MFLRIKKRKGNPQIPKNFPLNILLPLPPSPKLNLKSNTTKKKEEVKSKIKYNFKLQKKGRGGGLGTSFFDWTNNVNQTCDHF